MKTLMMILALVASVSAFAGGYPTSSQPAKGQWTVMGNSPYAGTVEQGCTLIGLTASECGAYQAMRAANTCAHMDVPNGVVLDRLLFTKDGKNVVQSGVKVALESAPNRRSRVCEVGGKAVISFDGCNNLALVNRWSPAPAPVAGKGVPRPYQKTALVGGCPLPNERFQVLSVLEEAAKEDSCAKPFIKSADGRLARPKGVTAEYDGNGLDEPRLSRTCGTGLNNRFKQGVLNHGFTVVVAEAEKTEYPIFQGAIKDGHITPASPEFADMLVGGYIRIPDAYTTGVVEIRFDDYGKLASPTGYHLRERIEKLTRGCEVTRATAIERSGAGAPAQATTDGAVAISDQ